MTIDVSKVRAICFDVDGTLRDTDDGYAQRFERYLRPVRFLFPNKDTRSFARWLVMTAESPANFFFGLPDRVDLDDDLVRWQDRRRLRRAERRRARAVHETLLIEGVRETLIQLNNHFPISVVTARPSFGTFLFLEQHNLTDLFVEIAHGQTTRYTKPYPDPIIWCAEKMNCIPSEVLMVGDTRPDVLAGKRAGAQVVGVLSGFGTEDELRRLGADEILNDVTELIDLLLGVESD